MRAFLNLRMAVPERREAFKRGLKRLGYSIHDQVTFHPRDGDILITWNRVREGGAAANVFDAAGLPVLVAENASWGNDFMGDRWYHLARGYHNTAGMFPVGGPDRWDRLGVELKPWRTEGETVVLGQRGIGPPGRACPANWAARQPGRLRRHPGREPFPLPLEKDLAKAGKVITWGSGAAIKALLWGIPVESHMPNWIGQQDNTDPGRLAMFRRLAWAQWTLTEIASGEPMARLLDA